MRRTVRRRPAATRVPAVLAIAVLAVATWPAATALGAQGVARDTLDDPDERWCAPVAARTATPDSVRAPSPGGGSLLIPFERESGDASLCLSGRERLVLLARLAADPLFYGEVTLGAGWGQWRRDPVAWGQDWRGFGRRLVLNGGSYVAYAVGEAAVAALLDVDPRPTFAPLARGRPGLGTALVNATTLRRRDGTRVVALPRLVGAGLAGWTFAQLRPEPVDARRVALDAVASFGIATATHVGAEYWRWWWRRRSAGRAPAR